MAGLGAAYALKDEPVDCVCYDKNSYYGGHTATFASPGGFLFDEGPHVSFTTNTRIQELFARNVDQHFENVAARINNYWRGCWIPHPTQCNLYGLPSDLRVRIIRDFVLESQRVDERPIDNYAEWLVAAYGKTFAESFPMQYGRKYHTTSMDRLTTDWLGPRMYRPDLEEVLRGALEPEPNTSMHYVTHFRYPRQGGFVSYLRPLAEHADVRLNRYLVGLDPVNHVMRFANGEFARYDSLVSSIPLPELIACMDGVPPAVAKAARRLAFTNVVIVNLGVARADLSEAHISYFYDPEIIFSRANFPHMLSVNNAPPGAGSIQVEIYYSDKYRPLNCAPVDLIPQVVRDLKRCGILRDSERLLTEQARLVRYANVIYDHERASALRTVHGYLDEIGVRYCGRYGEWDHSWTDQAFESGERAARATIESL
jgi:protoporphyrinogen oxidase